MPGCFSFTKRQKKAAASLFEDPEKRSDIYWQAPARVGNASTMPTESLPCYYEVEPKSDDGALKTISDTVDQYSSALREVSMKMHRHPEIGWKEVETSKLLSGYMEEQGFKVKRQAYGTETGWEAVFEHGTGGKTIGYNAEMDALPGIGHACGHNLIAVASLGAAIATAELLKKHDIPGKVQLLGTPAEEKDGGKILMLKNGGYKGMDVCLMSHPSTFSGLAPMLAVSECNVEYTGRGAHAAGAPWAAINALDAAVLAYNNISALRQQIEPVARVHGIILPSEDWACNVIPSKSKLQFGIRHPDLGELKKLVKRVEHCFEAAARSTGCTMKIEWAYSYADMKNNTTLAKEYQRYMQHEQKEEVPFVRDAFASTDFGDITYALPALHPIYNIPVKPGSSNHTPEFTQGAGTQEAHDNTMKVAKGLAAVALRVLTDSSFADAAKKEYEQHRKRK